MIHPRFRGMNRTTKLVLGAAGVVPMRAVLSFAVARVGAPAFKGTLTEQQANDVSAFVVKNSTRGE
jgi:hypothetical protein